MFLVVVKSSLQDLVSDYRAWLTWAAPQVQLYKKQKRRISTTGRFTSWTINILIT